jgi:hypothetical protein
MAAELDAVLAAEELAIQRLCEKSNAVLPPAKEPLERKKRPHSSLPKGLNAVALINKARSNKRR